MKIVSDSLLGNIWQNQDLIIGYGKNTKGATSSIESLLTSFVPRLLCLYTPLPVIEMLKRLSGRIFTPLRSGWIKKGLSDTCQFIPSAHLVFLPGRIWAFFIISLAVQAHPRTVNWSLPSLRTMDRWSLLLESRPHPRHTPPPLRNSFLISSKCTRY